LFAFGGGFTRFSAVSRRRSPLSGASIRGKIASNATRLRLWFPLTSGPQNVIGVGLSRVLAVALSVPGRGEPGEAPSRSSALKHPTSSLSSPPSRVIPARCGLPVASSAWLQSSKWPSSSEKATLSVCVAHGTRVCSPEVACVGSCEYGARWQPPEAGFAPDLPERGRRVRLDGEVVARVHEQVGRWGSVSAKGGVRTSGGAGDARGTRLLVMNANENGSAPTRLGQS
jgi:hypothetical protein